MMMDSQGGMSFLLSLQSLSSRGIDEVGTIHPIEYKGEDCEDIRVLVKSKNRLFWA